KHGDRGMSGACDSPLQAAPRVFRPVNARGAASPHYSMKVQFRGRRMAFTLGTGNKDAAAKRAAAIYGELLAHGIEATLARRRKGRPRCLNRATASCNLPEVNGTGPPVNDCAPGGETGGGTKSSGGESTAEALPPAASAVNPRPSIRRLRAEYRLICK